MSTAGSALHLSVQARREQQLAGTAGKAGQWVVRAALLMAFGLAGCGDSGVEVADTDALVAGDDNGPAVAGDPDSAAAVDMPDAAPAAPPVASPLAPVVALPAGTGATLSLAPHDDAFRAQHFSGSARCSACHDGLSDAAGNDVSIVADWSASLMANASRDPYWMAKVAYEMTVNPALSGELNDSCSRCHAPMANDAAAKSGTPLTILGADGLLAAGSEWFDHAMDGVSCTLCHQVEDDGLLGTPAGTSGGFSVAEKASAAERPAYGQYTDPVGAFMTAQVQFEPQYGAHLSTSASCGACHDLRTPAVDAGGGFVDAVGEAFFPEQMIFTEWRNSAYAVVGGANEQRCQDCHMPQVPGSVRLATRGGGVPRENFARHTFLGPNTVMQTLLMENREALGIRVPVETFERSIARNRDFMQQGADIRLQAVSVQANQLDASVAIDHSAGHKLPSGFVSRRVFVHFKVENAGGEVVFESGRPNADGSIEGVDNDIDPQAVEPHHELITRADQVQVYEAVMGDTASQVVHSLVRATGYVKDNRLLPVGLSKTTAPDEIAVTGAAVGDASFDAGGDVLNYRIALSGAGPFTVTAQLLYQPLAYGHLQDLFSKAAGPEVSTFRAWHDAQELKVEMLGVATAVVR